MVGVGSAALYRSSVASLLAAFSYPHPYPRHRPSAEEFMENLSTAANKLQETVPKVLEALKKA